MNMIARVARLVRAEALKLSAHPFLYASLAILAVAVVLSELLKPHIVGEGETAWRSYHAVQLFSYGFSFGLTIATLLLLVFSAMTFAGEFDRGTIKNLLTRPVTRADLFLAKAFSVAGLAVLLWLFVLYVSLALGLAWGELGPIWDSGGYRVQREYAMVLENARKAVLMTFLPLLAAGFLGILVSNVTESSGYAVAIALVLYIFADIFTGFLPDLDRQKVFLYYGPYALQKLQEYAVGGSLMWNLEIDKGLLHVKVPLLWLAGFIPPAFLIFRSRSVQA